MWFTIPQPQGCRHFPIRERRRRTAANESRWSQRCVSQEEWTQNDVPLISHARCRLHGNAHLLELVRGRWIDIRAAGGDRRERGGEVWLSRAHVKLHLHPFRTSELRLGQRLRLGVSREESKDRLWKREIEIRGTHALRDGIHVERRHVNASRRDGWHLLRRENSADLVLRKVEPELLRARSAYFQNFHVDRNLGARLVVGEHELAEDGQDRFRRAYENGIISLIRQDHGRDRDARGRARNGR